MPVSRRELLESLGVAAAGAITAGYTSTAKGFAANEEVTVGCIGTGGRCRTLMKSLATIPGVKIAAVADIWDVHLDEGKKLAQPNAFATKDYRAILDRKDIDAVLIGTPDHWHVPITVDACAAGKDVYVEKPLTHDL
jgi:predicted dehydrogenase